MTPVPRRLVPVVRPLIVAIAASGPLAAIGCGGDNPSRMAGTIELPARDPSRVDAKSFAKSQADLRKARP